MPRRHEIEEKGRQLGGDVSDIPGLAALTDPNLVNPWGSSRLPTSPLLLRPPKRRR
jgi:hypothetical protein